MKTLPRISLSLFWPLALLVSLFVLVQALSRFPGAVETGYTRFIYAGLTAFLTGITGRVPFSISEISLYLATGGVVFLIARSIRRRAWQAGVTALGQFLAIVLAWFYLGWGLNYFRLPVDEQLGFANEHAEPDSLALRQNLEWSLTATNTTWRQVPAWKIDRLDDEIEACYKRVYEALRLPLMPGKRPPKFPLISGVLNYTLTSGIFGPFWHEIHLSSSLLPIELPFVLAHEKAHQMGYARESEANFLAALVCLASADSSVQYSGYFALLGSFFRRAGEFSDRDSLLHAIRPEVRADFKAVRERVQKYQGAVSEVSWKTYDTYLRVNKVEGGTKNYGDVVSLMIRWRAHRGEGKP